MHKWLFWRIEQFEDWLCDLNAPDWMFVGERLNRLLCKLFGHNPIRTCHNPEHDECSYCRKWMPGAAGVEVW